MERGVAVAAHVVARKGLGSALRRRAFIAGLLKTNDERPTGATEKQLTTSSRRSAIRQSAVTRTPDAPLVLRAAALRMLFSFLGIAAAKQKKETRARSRTAALRRRRRRIGGSGKSRTTSPPSRQSSLFKITVTVTVTNNW
jgi:hypothetical protein